MDFEEYRKIAFEKLRESLKPFPEEEVEEYIRSLEDDVKESYYEDIAISELLGTDQVSPGGYAYGRMMMF
ncbi:MAG: hypothetical protein ACI4IX_09290 [Acutalibacteraceae bacterium]